MKLEVRDLSFWYEEKGRQILSQFSLSADSEERVEPSSPSGFGKTTLCKILSGYEMPQSGEVLLDGKTLKEYGTYRPVQMIWQHPEQAVNPRLRMKNVIEEGDRTDSELIEKLGIEPDWMNRFPTELSGGELQRFCIARGWDREHAFFSRMRLQTCDLITQSQIWVSLQRRQNGGISGCW